MGSKKKQQLIAIAKKLATAFAAALLSAIGIYFGS